MADSKYVALNCVASHILILSFQEEEALAQALSHEDMGPGTELTPEEEEELRYPTEDGQKSTLEQVNVHGLPLGNNHVPSYIITGGRPH